MTIDVIIPTYKPNNGLITLVEKLRAQTVRVNKIIIINTDKSLMSSQMLHRLNNMDDVSITHIEKSEFDHGNTRNLGVSKSTSDVFVMMTQDAEPSDDRLIENLTKLFYKDGYEKVAVSFARQLPLKDCGVAERFTRGFNYPEQSRIKTEEDVGEMGIKTYFCSNVCAAYRKDIFEQNGGFIKKTIFNEDMIYAGEIVKKGYSIGYMADACVYHSHNYSYIQYFRRNFDLGVSQAQNPQVFKGIKSEGEGMKLVKDTAAYLKEINKGYLIPKLIWNSGWKYLGYLLGKNYKCLPKGLIVACSDNKSYWN